MGASVRKHLPRILSICTLIGLTACGSAGKILTNQTQGVTGAPPLAPTSDELTAASVSDAAKKQFLLNQVTVSLNSCEDYKRLLLLSSRSSNLVFDVLTTVFGALGTAFTHIDVVHVFTAATTISSGTKTAIDADIYQNATSPLMVQAIQQTYSADMKTLLQKIEQLPAGQPVEFADLVQVHNECSLTEAMVDLQTLEQNQKLQQAQQQPQQTEQPQSWSVQFPKTGQTTLDDAAKNPYPTGRRRPS